MPHTGEAHVAPKQNGSNGVNGAERPRWGGGEYCPRCNKQVFIAEKRQAAGNVSLGRIWKKSASANFSTLLGIVKSKRL